MKVKIFSKHNYGVLKKFEEAFNVTDAKNADICIAIGGDGTLIKAAQNFDGPILPIRSNEPNSVGFYADVGIEDVDKIIELLTKKSYRIVELSKKMRITYNGRKYYAVNEALLKSSEQEVYFTLYRIKNGKSSRIYPFIMSGDGIIAATSVGSTAYNRSANGPILLTDKVLCLTFLNTDGPYKNAMVFDSSEKIRVKIEKYNGLLEHDNKKIAILKPGESFDIEISGRKFLMVKLNGMNEPLEKKLERLVMGKTVKDI